MRNPILVLSCFLFTGISSAAFAQAAASPTTEQFMGALAACVASKNLEVSADLLGSIKGAYDREATDERNSTQGRLVFKSPTEFLSLFPETDRLQAYKIYEECVTKLIPGAQSATFSSDRVQACTATLSKCKDDFKTDAGAAINSCNEYLKCDKNNPSVYSILGQAYRSAGQLYNSDASFERQLEIGQRLSDPATEGQAYNSLAINYNINNVLDKAESYVKQSIAINLSTNRTMLAANYKVMGDIYLKRGILNSAEDYFQRAIAIQKQVDDKNGLGNSYMGLGFTRLHLGDRTMGCAYLRQAYDIFSTAALFRMQNQAQRYLEATHC